jgi:hypothetical protein
MQDISVSRSRFQSASGLLNWIGTPSVLIIVLMTAELAAILALSNGRFSYTLDDAYIHLAVSEQLSRASYGINPGELSAPASSILWPVLLAPFARFSWHSFVPLILNTGLVLASVVVLRRLLEEDLGPVLRDGLTVLILLAGGAVPIAFTGMEHVLHIWLSLAALLGVCLAQQQKRAPFWLWPALAIAPLVRYEALALTIPLLIVLWLRGYQKKVVFTVVALIAVLGGFSAILFLNGLPPLPSSVLLKSPSIKDVGQFREELRSSGITIILGLLGSVLVASLANSRYRLLSFALAVATASRLAPGLSSGAFGRYDGYIITSDLAMLAVVTAPYLSALSKSRGPFVPILITALLLAPVWPNVLYRLASVPLASDNIGSQQREMHRFATEFVSGPVAVNDIGWVSYRNDQYVLDLWGLGLEEARLKRAADDPDWAEALLRRYDVPLMMIYNDWLRPAVPPGWKQIGSLVLTRPRISPAGAEVSFYARPDRASELAEEARRFAATLPAGASFQFTK